MMGQLRNAALMLGPVILTRFEAERGARVAVRVRQDSMPPEDVASAGAPDPGTLLLSLQKVQSEVSRDLQASASARSVTDPSCAATRRFPTARSGMTATSLSIGPRSAADASGGLEGEACRSRTP